MEIRASRKGGLPGSEVVKVSQNPGLQGGNVSQVTVFHDWLIGKHS